MKGAHMTENQMSNFDLTTLNQLRQIQQNSDKNFDSSLIDDFINFLDVSSETSKTYRKNLKPFFKFLELNQIVNPNRQNVIEYKRYLAELNNKPTTIQNRLVAIRQFFKWLNSIGFYPNITENVKSMKLDHTFKKDALTAKQATQLLHSIDRNTKEGKRAYAIIYLMVTTGLRTIEINRANIEDMRNVGNQFVLYIKGKGRTEKSEYVKITEHTLQAINDYLQSRETIKATEPLFVSNSHNSYNKRLSTRSISQIVKEQLKAINLFSPRLTAHSLRHTAGTLNMLSGGSLEETQQLLRHKNLQTTLIYSHALERMKNDSENRIDNFINQSHE